jgi:hypothetical protein
MRVGEGGLSIRRCKIRSLEDERREDRGVAGLSIGERSCYKT